MREETNARRLYQCHLHERLHHAVAYHSRLARAAILCQIQAAEVFLQEILNLRHVPLHKKQPRYGGTFIFPHALVGTLVDNAFVDECAEAGLKSVVYDFHFGVMCKQIAPI